MPVGIVTNQPSTIGGAICRAKEPTEIFRFIVNRHDKVLEFQFGLARWIMATLLVVNGGALLALLNSADKFADIGAVALFFLVGVVAALLGGILAWVNCSLVPIASDERLDLGGMDARSSQTADILDNCAWWVVGAAVVSALISLTAFPLGANQARKAFVPRATQARPIFTDEQMQVLENARIAKPHTPHR